MKPSEKRRELAEALMKDAMRKENSVSTREHCAFDAGYLYLLVSLDTPLGGTHPGIETIQTGIRQLDVDPEEMTAAQAFLKRQYSPERVGELLEELMSWAQQMKTLAGAA
jgi:hypothetical protein